MKRIDDGIPIVRRLKQRGFDAYFVGGCVRDYLLKDQINDIDITTNALPREVIRVFSRTIPTGEKYGTTTVIENEKSFEVTTYRIDGEYLDHRRPDDVEMTDSVLEDVKRRDFTINGMLMDENKKLFDYVGGLDDLNSGIIRAIGEPVERFNEDALRMLRAAYFQSKLGFEIEPVTKQAIKDNAHLLQELAPERILNEVLKILRNKHQTKALLTLEETTMAKYLPGLAKGISYISKKVKEVVFIDAFFVLAFSLNGKVDNWWKFSNIHKNKYNKAVELVLSNKDADGFVLYEYGLEITLLANKVSFLLNRKPYAKTKIEQLYNSLPIKSLTELAVKGNDILKLTNKKQGAWLKNHLNHLVEEVLKGNLTNNKEQLLKYSEEKLQ